jgi:putative spermidine/putrescine transport system permease protein
MDGMNRMSLSTLLARLSAWTVLAFVLGPLAVIVWVAFFADAIIAFPPSGYTLSWFARAWQSDAFRSGFLLSLQIGVIASLASLLLGIPASIAITRHSFPGREAISTILLAPIVVPGIVGGAALYIAMLAFELATGIEIAGTIGGLLIGHTLIAIPWTVRLVTASLLRVNRSIEEAAINLGATPFVAFRRITLPAIRPGLVAAVLLSFVVRMTLQIAILNYLEWNLDPTIAAVATVQIALIGAALVAADRAVGLSRIF